MMLLLIMMVPPTFPTATALLRVMLGLLRCCCGPWLTEACRNLEDNKNKIMTLFVKCTKEDVALNNYVTRARNFGHYKFDIPRNS